MSYKQNRLATGRAESILQVTHFQEKINGRKITHYTRSGRIHSGTSRNRAPTCTGRQNPKPKNRVNLSHPLRLGFCESGVQNGNQDGGAAMSFLNDQQLYTQDGALAEQILKAILIEGKKILKAHGCKDWRMAVTVERDRDTRMTLGDLSEMYAEGKVSESASGEVQIIKRIEHVWEVQECNAL
jgi:hypothetical protein